MVTSGLRVYQTPMVSDSGTRMSRLPVTFSGDLHAVCDVQGVLRVVDGPSAFAATVAVFAPGHWAYAELIRVEPEKPKPKPIQLQVEMDPVSVEKLKRELDDLKRRIEQVPNISLVKN